MNRFIVAGIATAVILGLPSCKFDLTEVQPEVRNARLFSTVEARTGSDTRVLVYLDPGTTERGALRSVTPEYVIIDGVAHDPTEVLADGSRSYEISDIPETRTLITIVPPSIADIGDLPTIAVVPLGLGTSDTLTAMGGLLEIPLLGTGDEIAWTHSSWNAVLYGGTPPQPHLSVAGQHPLPAVLRIPTLHLPAEVRGGHVDVAAVSSLWAPDPSAPVQITVQRSMRGSVSFVIPE